MPRKPRELDVKELDQLEALAAVLSSEQIADYFGIGRTTFYGIMERQTEVAERVGDLASQEYGAAYGRSEAQYNRELSAYDVDYNRGLSINEMTYNRAQKEKGDKIERLFRMSGLGGSATNVSAAAGARSSSTIAQANQANANIQAGASEFEAESINNALQGGIENYMTLQEYNKLKIPTTAGA